jgi:O-antigen/teichoic acid export membrane protein
LPKEKPRRSNNDTQGALPKGNGKPNVHGKRELAGDVITAFASLGLIAILEYADVVMVGAYSPSHAGAYGAVSVSAKSLIAWTVLLTNYLLPEAAIRWRLGGHAISELRNTMLLVLLPALLMFVIALSVPSLFLGLAFGNRLEGAASSLPYLTAAMAFLSITVVLSSYFFGVSWRGIPAVLMVGATVLVIAITAVQGRALQTAQVDLLVQSGIAVAMVVAFVVVHRRKSKVRSSPLLTGESDTIQATQLITGK